MSNFYLVYTSPHPTLLGNDLTPKQRYRQQQSEIRYARRRDSLPIRHQRTLVTGEVGRIEGFRILLSPVAKESP